MTKMIEMLEKTRGKRIDNAEWIYGSLDLSRQSGDEAIIRVHDLSLPYSAKKVDLKTVGLFTTCRDKKQNEIYAGDLLEIPHNNYFLGGLHEVFWFKGSFLTKSILFKNKENANKYDLEFIVELGAVKVGDIYDGSIGGAV